MILASTKHRAMPCAHAVAFSENLHNSAITAPSRFPRGLRAKEPDSYLGIREREYGVGLVSVDQPHFKPLMRQSSDVTSDVSYVRFHGRNAANWWRGTNATRYDYLYSREELLPWVERIVGISANSDVKEVFAFFNNHRRGRAGCNAEMLIEMLSERSPEVARADARASDAAIELPLS
jgi:uncharacterized protein YecE (DUF72 family)